MNAASGQEASHGTLGAILKGAKKNDSPLSGIRAKEGEYGAYSYNSEYGISAERVRQIETAALKKMRSLLQTEAA